MSYLLQRNQPLAQPPTLSSHNGVLATTITLGFLSASLSCGPNCVSPPFTAYALNGSIPATWQRVGAVAATLDAEIAAERASKNPPTKGTLHTPKTPPAAPASSARRLIVGLGVVAGAVLCLWRRRPRTVVGHYRPVSKENLAELAENIRA